ncbi:MAG TPA: SLC13/DASS family transporter [Polyangiaceae bacterium]|nr:SLC13/DASS family transporter [Polyangiaceae bacterium]
MSSKRTIFLALGPALGVVLGLGLFATGLSAKASWCAGVTAVCATWWVTEPIPIPATSLIPFGVFPLVGVLGHTEVATSYGHSLILLLLGGFMLSMAMEKSGAHRRLALGMVRLVGGVGGRRLVLGFMVAAAALSMWISNTATTLMLLPVALAVIDQADDENLTVPLLLGMAYSASVGGIGTPVGTPPNVILMGVYQEQTGKEISFLSWMTIGVPIVLAMLPLMWLWLTRQLGAAKGALTLPHPGPWRPAERRVLVVFGLTAVAWVTRSDPAGGWSAVIGATGSGDATVALAAVVALFLIPDGEGGQLLDWPTASKIPWGLLILFGGGIAIARGFGESGLSAALGEVLSALTTWPLLLMLIIIALSVTFLTEVTSNTATTSLLMPILAAAATAAAVDPRLLMVPAAISASCAFMLPVATAPNAIVFGTDRFTTRRMAGEGFVLNLLGAGVITLVCYLLLPR